MGSAARGPLFDGPRGQLLVGPAGLLQVIIRAARGAEASSRCDRGEGSRPGAHLSPAARDLLTRGSREPLHPPLGLHPPRHGLRHRNNAPGSQDDKQMVFASSPNFSNNVYFSL